MFDYLSCRTSARRWTIPRVIALSLTASTYELKMANGSETCKGGPHCVFRTGRRKKQLPNAAPRVRRLRTSTGGIFIRIFAGASAQQLMVNPPSRGWCQALIWARTKPKEKKATMRRRERDNIKR